MALELADFTKLFKRRVNGVAPKNGISKPQPQQQFTGYGQYRTLFTQSWNGEKNLGEIGPIKELSPDYEALRLRSWQSYLESEITQTVLNKFSTWVVGKGLKLQCEPVDEVLISEGIKELDSEKFCDAVETRFQLFTKSKTSDYSGMRNLKYLAKKAFINAKVGGDVLVILRYEKEMMNVQLVDGSHIISPLYGNEFFPQVLANGNRIVNGIELSPSNEHIAYYVRKPGMAFETTRVPCKGEQSGLTMAFLVYGMDYRIDNVRGIPLISVVLETLKKLERYKEATVGSAEERQKIVLQIVHELGGTGESPLTKQLAIAHDMDASLNEQLPTTIEGNQLADRVAASTNKQTYNLPNGAEMKQVESKNELYFKDFYGVNIDLVCSALCIPPEVAMSKYNSNFSASRAALKDWEHTLSVIRDDFASQFYQPIFDFWLEIEILKNKITAPGYILARAQNNYMVLEAYRNTRWVGAPVPHIDPLKEVMAERLKLGDTGASLPLTTVEAATETLNGGDSDSNMEQYAEELENSKKLKIIPIAPPIAPKPATA